MKHLRSSWICLALAAATPTAAKANLLVNGDFEADPTNQLGTTHVTGWTVYAGTVDLLHDPGVIDGLAYLETTGSPGAAIIGQSIPTTPGQEYLFHGLISHHPGLGTQTAKVDVTVNGLFVTELTHGGVETTLSDFKWQTFDVQFSASSTTSDLRLQDVTNLDPYRGALLDALSVTPIPEPSSLAVLGISGIAVLLRRRTRARHPEAK